MPFPTNEEIFHISLPRVKTYLWFELIPSNEKGWIFLFSACNEHFLFLLWGNYGAELMGLLGHKAEYILEVGYLHLG